MGANKRNKVGKDWRMVPSVAARRNDLETTKLQQDEGHNKKKWSERTSIKNRTKIAQLSTTTEKTENQASTKRRVRENTPKKNAFYPFVRGRHTTTYFSEGANRVV